MGSLQNSHESRITCLGLSADGSALCTGSWDTNLKVGNLYIACILSMQEKKINVVATKYLPLVIFIRLIISLILQVHLFFK